MAEKNGKKISIDADVYSIEALTDETIDQMAKATDKPEVFKKIMKDLKRLAQSKNKPEEFSLEIDTDPHTLLKMSDATLRKMANSTKHPELAYSILSELKKSARERKKEKVADSHIFWSWSYK